MLIVKTVWQQLVEMFKASLLCFRVGGYITYQRVLKARVYKFTALPFWPRKKASANGITAQNHYSQWEVFPTDQHGGFAMMFLWGVTSYQCNVFAQTSVCESENAWLISEEKLGNATVAFTFITLFGQDSAIITIRGFLSNFQNKSTPQPGSYGQNG